LNPQVWSISGDKNGGQKRVTEPYRPEIEPKRPKPNEVDDSRPPIYPERSESWTNPPAIYPTTNDQQRSNGEGLDPDLFFVLLTNIPYKSTNWDIQAFVEESNAKAVKTTHVYEPGMERSDAWIVELKTDAEAANLLEKRPPLCGRETKAELLTPAAAQEIYTNGYQPHRQRRDNFPSENKANPPNISAPVSLMNFMSQTIAPPPGTKKPQSGGFFSAPAYGNRGGSGKRQPPPDCKLLVEFFNSFFSSFICGKVQPSPRSSIQQALQWPAKHG
jgi:hypothetical protein